MKKLFLGLGLLAMSFLTFAQNDLDGVFVEEIDASVVGAGYTTYRVFVDMAPGAKLVAVNGNGSHYLKFTTTTSFFNSALFGGFVKPVLGEQNPDGLTGADFLDSWLTIGRYASDQQGIVRGTGDDTDGDGYIPGFPVDPATSQPYIVSLSPAFPGDGSFGSAGASFSTNDAAYYIGDGIAGTGTDNLILIGQFTTDGDFSLELNVQIKGADDIARDYVASNPVGAEILNTSLIWPAPAEGCTDPTACNYDPTAIADDGSCVFAVDPCDYCEGGAVVDGDINDNGICDVDEILGCNDPAACNYNSDPSVVNVPSLCLYADNTCTACAGTPDDGTGTVVDIDQDVDAPGLQTCDDIEGCMSSTACNYNEDATYQHATACVEPVDNCLICDPADPNNLIMVDSDNDGICDAEEASYEIADVTASCIEGDICLPLRTLSGYAMENIIGFDAILEYDETKLNPTGVVTVYDNATVGTEFTGYEMNVDYANGVINLAIFLNGSAPAGSHWSGEGDVFCVHFNKAGLGIDDATELVVTELIESRNTGIEFTSALPGTYTSEKDVYHTGTLKFWRANQPIVWDENNPGKYLATKIYGVSGASCEPLNDPFVRPNLYGEFIFDSNNGDKINIDRNIAASTSVMSVINSWDAYRTLQVVLNINDPDWTPSVYQMIAMDVNMDGAVTAGDVSQINQRTVRIINEFRQAWNYNDDGTQKAEYYPSKDWVFQTQAAYDDAAAAGFDKFNVPVVPRCVDIPGSADGCSIDDAMYKGVLLGDVSGNYRDIAPDGVLKSAKVAEDKIILSLADATIAGNYIDIPVTVESNLDIVALDFRVKLNEAKLTFETVSEKADYLFSAVGNFADDTRELLVTATATPPSGLIETYSVVCKLRFRLNASELLSDDFEVVEALLNETEVELDVIEAEEQGVINNIADVNAVSLEVYPNPATEVLNVKVSENATVTLYDVTGKVFIETNVKAMELLEMNVKNLAAGVYTLKVSNNEKVRVERVVIQ